MTVGAHMVYHVTLYNYIRIAIKPVSLVVYFAVKTVSLTLYFAVKTYILGYIFCCKTISLISYILL